MTIKGNVKDTNANAIVSNAVAIAIRVKDSIMLDFKRTDKFGNFEMTLPIDTIELIVRHPEYGDFKSYLFGSKDNNVFELNPLVLSDKSTSLSEFVIYANKSPIYYRGDTLVYVADSFKVKENAVVEDLIKKLPGMKIDENGKITNQGKEINKVLVDGDEFFGSDPTIATKNLAANGVETVQVYEKDSEDGSDEKIQVLDLKLKEGAKKGYFGKLNVAGGLDQFKSPNRGLFENELLLNKYNTKQKIALFALSANTPKSDFNGRDAYKFGLSEGRMWGNETDDFEGFGGGSGINTSDGIPQTFKAGFYLDQKLWKGGAIRLNYSYSDNIIRTKSSSYSQYLLDENSYSTNVNNDQKERYEQHQVGVKFTQQIDSLTKIEIEPKLQLNKTNQTVQSSTDFFFGDTTTPDRTTIRSNSALSNGENLNTTLRLFKDFKKKNRKLIARYNVVNNRNSSTGTLNTSDSKNDSLRFDQNKQSSNLSLAQTGYLNYVEPLTKKWKTEFDYEYYSNNNEQSKTTRGIDPLTGELQEVDNRFSNGFKTNRTQHRAGAFLIFENNKVRVSLGSRVRDVKIDNNNLFTQNNIKQSQLNVLPRAVVQFKFTSSSRLRIQYNTTSSLPSVDQLQPVQDNTNPNFIQIGNPNLKPNYSHILNANYNMWSGLSGFYVYSGLSLNHQSNAFSTSTNYLPTGQSFSQTINVKAVDFASFYGGAGIPFKKIKDLRLDVNLNGSISSLENVINNITNTTLNRGIGTDLSLNYNGDSLTTSLAFGINYNSPKNSLTTVSNQPYSNYDISYDIDWTLPFQFFVKSDITYYMNTGRTQGYNINYTIWNASIQRSFLKTQNLLFGIEAYDILNQNIANSRDVSTNVIVDQRSSIIKRYFMFKVTLKFNNNHTTEADDKGWF